MNVADTESDGRGQGREGRPDPSGARERLTVGSLFSGIGGFDLGLERAGMRTVWFCEQDEFCRGVLAKHWPGVPCYPDVRALVSADPERERSGASRADRRGPTNGAEDHEAGRRRGVSGVAHGSGREDRAGLVPVPVPYVDVLCGGFPCQDLSVAGKGAGIDGQRSGLWGEYARLIRELRPRYVLVENVAALLGRGLGRVLGDLAACGYDAEWDCVPASAVGAPHRRDRLWIVAYPNEEGCVTGRVCGDAGGRRVVANEGGAVPDSQRSGPQGRWPDAGQPQVSEPRNGGALADAEGAAVGAGLRESEPGGLGRGRPGDGSGEADEGRALHDPVRGRHGPPQGQVPAGRDGAVDAGWWAAEPDVGRVAHGVPNRVDRLAALGNALVPQIAEWLGHRIMQHELLTEEKGP